MCSILYVFVDTLLQWCICLESIAIFKSYIRLKIFFNIYSFLRDRVRQSMNRGGEEREGDTESKAGSRLGAISTEPDAGLEPTNSEITTWVEIGHVTDSATQGPQTIFLNYNYILVYFSTGKAILFASLFSLKIFS